MKQAWVATLTMVAGFLALGCGDSEGDAQPGCARDDQCKGDRVCVDGACVNPDGSGSSTKVVTTTVDGGTVVRAGGTGGTAVTVTPTPGQPLPVEATCIANCELQFAEECYPEDSPFTFDQCQASCLFIEESRQGYCLVEELAFQECQGRGGYTCAAERPLPNDACLDEQADLTKCLRERPCAQHCDEAKDRGCSTGRDACFTECLGELNSFETSCQSDYTRLISCWQVREVCPEDRGTHTGCLEEVAEVADCLETYEDQCAGYCWAGELLGCAPDSCRDFCIGKQMDPACGRDWDSLIRCTINYSDLYLKCDAGELVPTIDCKSDSDTYEACLIAP